MAEKKKRSATRYSVDDNRVIDEWYGVVVVESGDKEKLSEIAEQMNDSAKAASEKEAKEETLAQYDSPTSFVGEKIAERIPSKSHSNDSETQIRRSMLEKEPNTAPDAEIPPDENGGDVGMVARSILLSGVTTVLVSSPLSQPRRTRMVRT